MRWYGRVKIARLGNKNWPLPFRGTGAKRHWLSKISKSNFKKNFVINSLPSDVCEITPNLCEVSSTKYKKKRQFRNIALMSQLTVDIKGQAKGEEVAKSLQSGLGKAVTAGGSS